MDIRENFFMKRMVRHWNRPPSLEVFKKCEAVALGSSAGLMAGLSDLGGIFQPKNFHDSVIFSPRSGSCWTFSSTSGLLGHPTFPAGMPSRTQTFARGAQVHPCIVQELLHTLQPGQGTTCHVHHCCPDGRDRGIQAQHLQLPQLPSQAGAAAGAPQASLEQMEPEGTSHSPLPVAFRDWQMTQHL